MPNRINLPPPSALLHGSGVLFGSHTCTCTCTCTYPADKTILPTAAAHHKSPCLVYVEITGAAYSAVRYKELGAAHVLGTSRCPPIAAAAVLYIHDSTRPILPTTHTPYDALILQQIHFLKPIHKISSETLAQFQGMH